MPIENTHEFTNTFAPIRFADNVQTVLIQSGDGTLWLQPNGGALRTWPGTRRALDMQRALHHQLHAARWPAAALARPQGHPGRGGHVSV